MSVDTFLSKAGKAADHISSTPPPLEEPATEPEGTHTVDTDTMSTDVTTMSTDVTTTDETITVTTSTPVLPETSALTNIDGTTVSSVTLGSSISHATLTTRSVLTPVTGSVESRTGPRVKLPKISLKRFDGILTKWASFWDTFESLIHHHPTLSNVDKFNYLSLLLDSTAADAISGLSLTAANYEEAVAILKKRFGNKQLIIGKHMDALLNLEGVVSQHNLRHLYDIVESHV